MSSDEAYTTAEGLTIRMVTEHLVVDAWDNYEVTLTITPPRGYRADQARTHELIFYRKIKARVEGENDDDENLEAPGVHQCEADHRDDHG